MLFSLVFPAVAFDATHARLQKVLDATVSGGRVSYAAIKAAPGDLDAYLAEVATAPVSSMSAADRKAFYINAYNACTIDTVADSFPLKSIMDLDGGKVWDSRRFAVGGAQLTLNDIENKHLRPLGDPRIHAALNCASLGCPPLSGKAFTGAALEGQLEGVAKKWAAAASITGATLSINRIYEWYGDDFLAKYGAGSFDIPGIDGKPEAAANFIAHYAPEKAEALKKGGYAVVYADYSWAVNAK